MERVIGNISWSGVKHLVESYQLVASTAGRPAALGSSEAMHAIISA